MPLPSVFQASKATTLTATCPCHLFFRGFKTAVCPASNAPNLPQASKATTLTAIHAPAICFSAGSRLPFARPQTLQTLPQASKATTLTATCPCHLFFRGFKTAFARPQTLQTLPQASKAKTLTATCPCHLFFSGFKTAVCPASNLPNASAGLQGNNSYSYMPLPSVFQGVQDPFAQPQTLQTLPQASKATTLTATCPCHLFFRGFKSSRLPFARPQTLQTLPQASKATTLTATCPCHLFFRGFKTAVCPASNPPNASAGLQGNNSYSYMPLPSAFSGGSRLPFARPQTLQTLPQASKATTLAATCPCHLFFRGFKTAVCPASNPPNASAGLQGNNSYSYIPLPSVFQRVQDCRLPGLKPSKPSAGLQGNNSYSYMPLPSAFSRGSRLPFARPQTLQTLPQASKRQQLLHLHAPAICFSAGSRLPFARPQTLQTLPQASKATTLTATCPCHLLFQGVQDCRLPGLKPSKPFRRPPRQQLLQLHAPAICFSGGSRVQDCRLPGLKPSKPFRRPTRQQLLQLDAPAVCFSGGSRLPFARPQTLQTLPQASKATTLTATCPCHLFFRGFKTAVCPASNAPNLPQASKATTLTAIHAPAICFSGGSRLPFARPQTLQTLPQASKATTLTATCPCHLFFRGFKTAVCPASNPPNASAGLQGNNSYSYMPLPSAFSGGSRLPFARPQTLQTLPQASKATTLTATCPCHLFFRGFKTAVCPASNPPNPSAGLQGNNSYSYMALPQASKATTLTATCPCRLFFKGFKTAVCPASNPSVFQELQDCRLPGLKRSKPPQALPFARPQTLQTLPQASKATTLTATCPCHLFFRGFKSSRLPFARPQTLQTLPQASKATTIPATCPCHLFFQRVQDCRLPGLKRSKPSAGLQGNNSYSYMPLPSVFQGVQDCRLPGLKPSKPFRRPPRQQLLQLHGPSAGLQGNNSSYSYMPLPSVFQGVQDCRLPGLKPICFSGGSRLPFARPQTLQTSAGTAVCPASNAPNPSAGLQGNNSYS